jgi:hypothetical protein
MAKEHLIEIYDEITLNGRTATVLSGTIVRATPNKVLVGGAWVENVDGAGEYIRLHRFDTGANYLWTGELDAVDENTELEDPRWAAE